MKNDDFNLGIYPWTLLPREEPQQEVSLISYVRDADGRLKPQKVQIQNVATNGDVA